MQDTPLVILNGWKEIANYVSRGVRTVQRWERFGLPVHRPAGQERTAVFALGHELDQWLLSRPTLAGMDDDELIVRRLESLRAEVQRLEMQLASRRGLLDGASDGVGVTQ